ncbi:MAG: ABC transporter permease, partial [Bacteroidota bacterium]
MLSNYLKVALRNIAKHKFFSIINILGLTVGIAACLLISVYVIDELNYDHFHEKGAQMYRINLHGKLAGQDIKTTNSCPPLAQALVDELPEVSEAIRVSNFGDWVFRYNELSFVEEDVFVSDSNFFSFFGFPLVKGNPETALKKPNSVVLTETLAKKYFGDGTALGQTLILGNGKDNYEVTGVMKDVPGNSHLKFQALLSTSTFNQFRQPIWLNNNLWTYYILNDGGNSEEVDRKLEEITDRNVAPTLIQFMGKSLEDFKAEGGIYKYYSMPMFDIHLRSQLQDEAEAPGDISYVYILSAIGIFILLIACINFMNLSTAQSAGRAKEVGLRKTLGSLRSYLIGQFLTESFIYSLAAAILAFALVYFLMPSFNQMSGKTMSLDMLFQPLILLLFSGIIVFVGLMAGSYPAFYLTSFKITETLKGKLKAGMKSGSVRGVLVTFQFWISIILIICTAIVYQQLEYVQDKNLGIDKEHIIMFKNTGRLDNNSNAFKVELEQHSSVESASFSNNSIPGVNNTTIFRSAGNDADHILATYFADPDHLQTMGFEMSDGRFFSRDFLSDSGAVVLNEAAVAEFGWDSAIGEKIFTFNGDAPETKEV